jgi:hypothetical protein
VFGAIVTGNQFGVFSPIDVVASKKEGKREIPTRGGVDCGGRSRRAVGACAAVGINRCCPFQGRPFNREVNQAMKELSLEELDNESVEVLPARELMCGGCGCYPDVDISVSLYVSICL